MGLKKRRSHGFTFIMSSVTSVYLYERSEWSEVPLYRISPRQPARICLYWDESEAKAPSPALGWDACHLGHRLSSFMASLTLWIWVSILDVVDFLCPTSYLRSLGGLTIKYVAQPFLPLSGLSAPWQSLSLLGILHDWWASGTPWVGWQFSTPKTWLPTWRDLPFSRWTTKATRFFQCKFTAKLRWWPVGRLCGRFTLPIK